MCVCVAAVDDKSLIAVRFVTLKDASNTSRRRLLLLSRANLFHSLIARLLSTSGSTALHCIFLLTVELDCKKDVVDTRCCSNRTNL